MKIRDSTISELRMSPNLRTATERGELAGYYEKDQDYGKTLFSRLSCEELSKLLSPIKFKIQGKTFYIRPDEYLRTRNDHTKAREHDFYLKTIRFSNEFNLKN